MEHCILAEAVLPPEESEPEPESSSKSSASSDEKSAEGVLASLLMTSTPCERRLS